MCQFRKLTNLFVIIIVKRKWGPYLALITKSITSSIATLLKQFRIRLDNKTYINIPRKIRTIIHWADGVEEDLRKVNRRRESKFDK